MLRRPAFSVFRCDQPTSLGMNIESLSKKLNWLLKLCGRHDALKLRHDDDSQIVSFQCESTDENKVNALSRIVSFDLELVHVDSSDQIIPEEYYTDSRCSHIEMPSVEFLRICTAMKEMGETCVINANADGASFTANDLDGSGTILVKPCDSEVADQRVSLTVGEPVEASFALCYLVALSRAAPFCGMVKLSLRHDAPLLVKYSTDAACFQFYVAPKI